MIYSEKGDSGLTETQTAVPANFSIIISLHIEKEQRCIFLDHKIYRVSS